MILDILVCLSKIVIDVINDHTVDVIETLKHEKEHGTATNKGLDIGDIIP